MNKTVSSGEAALINYRKEVMRASTRTLIENKTQKKRLRDAENLLLERVLSGVIKLLENDTALEVVADVLGSDLIIPKSKFVAKLSNILKKGLTSKANDFAEATEALKDLRSEEGWNDTFVGEDALVDENDNPLSGDFELLKYIFALAFREQFIDEQDIEGLLRSNVGYRSISDDEPEEKREFLSALGGIVQDITMNHRAGKDEAGNRLRNYEMYDSSVHNTRMIKQDFKQKAQMLTI